eukprot:COSAG02_NODE_4654_length_5128_cov_15.002585_3_plen_53_part_00
MHDTNATFRACTVPIRDPWYATLLGNISLSDTGHKGQPGAGIAIPHAEAKPK